METKVDYDNCIWEIKIEKTKLISNNNKRYYYSFIKVLITTSPHYIAALKITEYSSNEYKIGRLFIYGSNLILRLLKKVCIFLVEKGVTECSIRQRGGREEGLFLGGKTKKKKLS